MNERFFYLAERHLQGNITPDERSELKDILDSNPALRKELSEQEKIKEVINKMQLKNPSREFWDKYWQNTYNRAERSIAWLLIISGAAVVLTYAAIEAAEQFIQNTETPWILKLGIAALVAGAVILLVTVIREKFFSYKKDQYKEIQR